MKHAKHVNINVKFIEHASTPSTQARKACEHAKHVKHAKYPSTQACHLADFFEKYNHGTMI